VVRASVNDPPQRINGSRRTARRSYTPRVVDGESVRRLVLDQGYERREQPFQLSSGAWSHDYVDMRRVLARGQNLRAVAEAILALASSRGLDFDAVGGLTMGADPLSHAIALLGDKGWFAVRKEAKKHGRQRLIEGTDVVPGTRVLLVDDVVTTGASIVRAFEAVVAEGAEVLLAVAVVDRGDAAGRELRDRGVPYEPLLTYRDLGIEPVGD
jgi:orotate phosphoribosyltransferase